MSTPSSGPQASSEQPASKTHFFTDAFGEPCELALNNDPICRFRYVANVIGLEKQDEQVLFQHREVTQSFVPAIVDRVYEKMFQYLPMKKHFADQHDGFHGHVPNTIDEVTLDNEQTVFRKQRLAEFLTKLSTAAHDETFAVLLDLIGGMHTAQRGNPNLAVPVVQLAALLGFIADQFFWTIQQLDQLKPEDKAKLQSAYNKIFWVQNSMFLRHHAI